MTMISGHIHPLTWTIRETVEIFRRLGFSVMEGPELETAEYNFDRLNFPPDHPARDMHDTFWLNDKHLLRTHTSTVQIRAMEKLRPPVRIMVPGRVFRNERTDASHEMNFYHFEGFAIDKDANLANLLFTLESFTKQFFGTQTEVRFRPSFFPFVEPGLEMLAKVRGRWMELLGAGMIHPHVIREMNLDPNEWQGFAFGLGVDRFMMIRYSVGDIRFSYSGDFRFLKQFPGVEK